MIHSTMKKGIVLGCLVWTFGSLSPRLSCAQAPSELRSSIGDHRRSLVEACCHLRDLPAQLPRLQPGRHGRPEWDYPTTRLSPRSRSRCDLDCTDLPVTAGGFRLRYFRLS